MQTLFSATHDVSEGGIAQTIVEMAVRSGVGARLEVPTGLQVGIKKLSKTKMLAVSRFNRSTDSLICNFKNS